MKIVFHSYNTCCQNDAGGVQNRLRKIASLLKDRGFQVELFNPFETKLQKGDILHIFMLSLDNASLIQYAKRMGVKIVMSTIIPLIGERKLKMYKAMSFLPSQTTYKLNRKSLLLCDALITESQQEGDFIIRNYGVDRTRICQIPNGVDIGSHSGDEIYERIGGKKQYVLQVGRFDANKNQLNVIRALKGTGVNVVFIGGAEKSSSCYYDECVKEAEGFDNFHFLGWIDSKSEVLDSAYSHADTVILASHFETFGLTAIEGASKGAKVIFSNKLPIHDYPEFRDCLCFNPSNVTEIKEAIIKSLTLPHPENLQERVINGFSWKSVIDKHIELYKSL